MVPFFLLVSVLCFGVGGYLKIAIDGKSNRLGAIAGWLLLATPLLMMLAVLLKHTGPMFWYTLPDWLFSPWISLPLALCYLLVVPVRSAWRRARIHRDEANLLERSRTLDPAAWPGLDYQALADQLGVPAVPINLSMDVETGYAIGFPARRILIPAGWVPKVIRGDQDDYWFDVPEEPVATEEMKAILAHELAHHGDLAGLKGLFMETAGYLLPWEFVAGSGTNYADHWPALSKRIKPGVAQALTSFSAAMAWLGQKLWRGAIDAERTRQERVADQEAVRVFPPARVIISSIRGFMYSEPQKQPGRISQAFGLVLGSGLLALGMALLPGRDALTRLAGGETPIPWQLPEGWTVVDPTPPLRVNHAGFLRAHGSKPERIRIEYSTPLNEVRVVGNVGVRLYFEEGQFHVPSGAHLIVEWPVTTRLGWLQRFRPPIEKAYAAADHNPSPIFATIQVERGPVPPNQSFGYMFKDRCEVIPAGGNRQILRMDWGPFLGMSPGASRLDIGLLLYGNRPGTYDLEAPTVKVIHKDGTILRLDSSHFALERKA